LLVGNQCVHSGIQGNFLRPNVTCRKHVCNLARSPHSLSSDRPHTTSQTDATKSLLQNEQPLSSLTS
jgi:hypothetical protein